MRLHQYVFRSVAVLFVCLGAVQCFAKSAPLQVVDWPATGTPTVRFTFDKFGSLASMGNLRGYVMNVAVQNLSTQVISARQFSVYFFDKSKTRIGEDVIEIKNVAPGETVKFATTVTTSGQPVSVSLQESSEIARKILLTVNSSPQGAVLSLDGAQVGSTPRMVSVGVGHHLLSFAKEGFNTGTFPLDITREDISGGSVTYDLGAAAYDSVELRDGTTLTGDLVSISGMEVQVRVGGAVQRFDRNQIKRILLVQRDTPKTDALPGPVTK